MNLKILFSWISPYVMSAEMGHLQQLLVTYTSNSCLAVKTKLTVS
jgi:hypothetical protein